MAPYLSVQALQQQLLQRSVDSEGVDAVLGVLYGDSQAAKVGLGRVLDDLGTGAQEVPPTVGASRGQRGEEDVDLAEEDILAQPKQGLVPQAHSGRCVNRERNHPGCNVSPQYCIVLQNGYCTGSAVIQVRYTISFPTCSHTPSH